MKKLILIVDDYPEVRNVIRAGLEQEQFEFREASNGDEGLRLATELRPDLVLLDVMMPGMDGYEVCRRLKADQATADIRVIIMTATGKADGAMIAEHAGADAFLAKPFDIASLTNRVDAILSGF